MNRKQFLAAMYLRLSRDDSDVGDVTDREGNLKSESNSIGNQRELIRAFIHEQQDMELYDIYVEEYLLRLLKALPRVNLRNIGLCRINCIKVILISYCLELVMGSRKVFSIRKELDNNSSSILF